MSSKRKRMDEIARLLIEDPSRPDFYELVNERNLLSVDLEIQNQKEAGKWTPAHNVQIFSIPKIN
jgi:hypothetical protein